MNHLKLIAWKMVASLVVLYLILGWGYGVAFTNVLLLTVVLGFLSYVLGDLFILGRTNNTVATISDFVLCYVVIYFMLDMFAFNGNILMAAFWSSVGLTVFEFFFHKSVEANRQEHEDERVRNRRIETYQYQTETSKDYPYSRDDF